MISANSSHRAAIAGRYWKAAHTLLTNQSQALEYFEPVGLLLGSAAELSLKCVLENDGVPPNESRDQNYVTT